MDKTYNDVFENLFSEFPIDNSWRDGEPYRYDFNGVLRVNLREVRNYIASVVNEGAYGKIRPDAKLFLICNYFHMVLLPVLMANYDRGNEIPLDAKFKKSVSDDIDKILRQAREQERNEISSHTILTAIDRIWEDLFTTVKMSWSRDNNN